MKVLPHTIDKEIIEISQLWKNFKTTHKELSFAEVISYREMQVEENASNAGKFKLKGEAKSHWHMYELLDNYIKQWGCGTSHALVKANSIIAKARHDEQHVLGVLMNSFLAPTIYWDKISANFDFNKNNTFEAYYLDKELFEEYVDEFRVFINSALDYQKAIDVLYDYSEKMPDIKYFIETEGYTVELNFIANNLSFSAQELAIIEYWEKWLQSDNCMPVSIDTYDSFKNLTYYPKLKSLPSSFLVLGYSSEDKQFNICFQEGRDIFCTQSVDEVPIIYLSKKSATHDAQEFQGEYAENFTFVGEYKNGKLVAYHLVKNAGCDEEDYQNAVDQISGMLEKFKLEEIILNTKSGDNKKPKKFKV